MFALELAAAGVAFGCIAALSGLGLLITYKGTGVFNLAHGAMAMFVAYVHWQLVSGWGWSEWIAAPLSVFAVGPALGIIAYRGVFRELARRTASAAESLVASLGLFVLLVGIVAVAWGPGARRAPDIFPTRRIHLFGTNAQIGSDALVELAVVAVAVALLGLVTTRTRLGVHIRAVVDRRELAELSGVDADRVATICWAVGAGFAGLTGVLLAPRLSLTPYGLTLVVLETFAIPVIARLSSLGIAVGAGIAIGIAQSELTQVHLNSQWATTVVQGLESNLLVVALLVALLVLPRLHELGGDAGVASAFATRDVTARSAKRLSGEYVLAAVLLATPLLFPSLALREAQQVPGLALVFVSLVVLTGYSGQISLGQAGYAGLGALFFGIFSQSTPELVALFCGMLAAGIVGFLTGYPAIRRRGLFLALMTFAVGVTVSRFVFQEPFFTNGVHVNRPGLFGISLSGDRAFYIFELACLAIGLLVVRGLRSGRLGRSLVAMRDSEPGARAIGIEIRKLKIFIFTVSATLAGLGGALIAQTSRAFDPNMFDPVQGSLFWFTAVVVFGADSAAGAVAAAGLVVMINKLVGDSNAALIVIGGLALLLGRLPGGVVEGLRSAARARLYQGLSRPPRPEPAPKPRLSPAGRALAARLRP